MTRNILSLLILCLLTPSIFAQKSAKAAYAEIGGPGLASVNYDMRFAKKNDGLGWRAGIGGFSISDGYGDRVSILTLPVGINYLLGKDDKNYFEVGVGFTYISTKDNGGGNFNSSFGNLTIGYRHAPAGSGFLFKAEITPVFGSGFFIPYYGGIGFGYKF